MPERILFVTDSLGLPRTKPEALEFDDLWHCKLSRTYSSSYEYHSIGKKGLTTKNLKNMKDDIILYKPSIVILQLGIVDFAPRALKKHELEFLKLIGGDSNFIKRTVTKNHKFISKLRDISYVTLKDSCNNLLEFRETMKVNNIKIICVGVLKPSNIYMNKSPMIKERYTSYSKLQTDIFKSMYFEPFKNFTPKEMDQFVMSDGYHLNKRGHVFLFEEIQRFLIKKGVL